MHRMRSHSKTSSGLFRVQPLTYHLSLKRSVESRIPCALDRRNGRRRDIITKSSLPVVALECFGRADDSYQA